MSKEKIKDTTMVCKNCGSSQVETKMWVKVNTDEINGTCSDGDPEDNYCCNCSGHYPIITYKEYKKLNK